MITSKCKRCGGEIIRLGSKPGVYCSRQCKNEASSSESPYTKDWLFEHYVTKGLSTYAIAKIVSRNPKTVYGWLRSHEIPTRAREWSVKGNSRAMLYQNRAWLLAEYLLKGRSQEEIAEQFGVHHQTVSHFMAKFKIPTRTSSERWQINPNPPNAGSANPMFGRTRERNPNWKGGCSPERQEFYASTAWKAAKRIVFPRDKGQCQRCGRSKCDLEYHHLVAFAVRELRAEPSNLVLLCDQCHDFVHSKKNVDGDFIVTVEEWEDSRAERIAERIKQRTIKNEPKPIQDGQKGFDFGAPDDALTL